MFDELLTVLNEYKTGASRMAHKYLQRFGSPGNYRYIYPIGNMDLMGRRAKFYWKRILGGSKGFLSKIHLAYDPTHFGVKPKTWHTAVVNLKMKNGGLLQMHVDLKSHHIYSYRSKRGQNAGNAVKLGRAKKRGILRYR